MKFKTNKEKWNSGLGMAQVKSTGCKTAKGTYQVALKSCGGTNGGTYKTLIDTKIDFLFVLNERLETYLIPKNKISNKSTLNLCDKYREYKVKIWNLWKCHIIEKNMYTRAEMRKMTTTMQKYGTTNNIDIIK